MKDQDIALAILVVVVVAVVIIALWYFLTRGSRNEPLYKKSIERAERAEGDPDDITSLEKKRRKLREQENEISDEEDAIRDREVANLKNQIKLLNLQSGMEIDQIKYLTANVNRTIYPPA